MCDNEMDVYDCVAKSAVYFIFRSVPSTVAFLSFEFSIAPNSSLLTPIVRHIQD